MRELDVFAFQHETFDRQNFGFAFIGRAPGTGRFIPSRIGFDTWAGVLLQCEILMNGDEGRSVVPVTHPASASLKCIR